MQNDFKNSLREINIDGPWRGWRAFRSGESSCPGAPRHFPGARPWVVSAEQSVTGPLSCHAQAPSLHPSFSASVTGPFPSSVTSPFSSGPSCPGAPRHFLGARPWVVSAERSVSPRRVSHRPPHFRHRPLLESVTGPFSSSVAGGDPAQIGTRPGTNRDATWYKSGRDTDATRARGSRPQNDLFSAVTGVFRMS